MNLQSILLVGILLGNNVVEDVNNYERIYTRDYNQKQEGMYLEQVEENPRDVTALTELAEYYEEMQKTEFIRTENFNKAETVYKEIIEIAPESTSLAEFYLGMIDGEGINIYYIYGKDDRIDFYKKTENELLRLLELDNDNIEIMTGLGDVYSDIYYDLYYDDYSYTDINVELFDKAEKMYFDVLSIDENNIDIRYKLIELYELEWIFYKNEGYFDKVEQQYLEILNVDKNYIDARQDLIDFYEDAYEYMDINCIDKMEEQLLEISKIQPQEQQNLGYPMDIAGLFECIWHESEYTDNEAFEKAEYYYKYVLSIEPDNSDALYELSNMYKDGYRYGNINNEENFKKAEQVYKQYPEETDEIYPDNVHFYLASLYEEKWNKDKSDYTYYYMAENELYNALEFELKLEAEDVYSIIDPMYVYMSLAELGIDRYEFDGDMETCNTVKNLLLEQISNTYSDEVTYVDSDDSSYVDEEKLNELGILYRYVWKLDTDDMQYYEKAEKIFLELLELENDYYVLFDLGELYSERWLLDKSNVEYKLKAVQCFDEILASPYGSWYGEDIYPILDKLEL